MKAFRVSRSVKLGGKVRVSVSGDGLHASSRIGRAAISSKDARATKRTTKRRGFFGVLLGR
jgi:hypothetical protein